MNLRDWAEEQRRHRSGRTAVMYMGQEEPKTIAWEKLLEDVERTAHMMETRKHKRICFLGENSYSYLVCLLAVIGSGNTAVPLNRDLEDTLLSGQMLEAEGSLLLIDRENMERGEKFPIPYMGMEEVLEKGRKSERHPLLGLPEEQEACILFSSGTGGKSKAVILSQKNLLTSLPPVRPETEGGILLCMPHDGI